MKWPAISATALIVLSLALSGCDVRIDTPPPAIPSIDAEEEARQQMALAVREVISSLDSVPIADAGPLDDANAHLEALGGVWEAPDYFNEGNADSEETLPPDLATAFNSAATQAVDMVSNVSKTMAPLYGSLAVYYHQAGVDHHDAPALRGPEEGGYRWPTLPKELETQVIMVLDQLGFLWERQAARSAADDRTAMMATATLFRQMANDFVHTAGLAGTDKDPRLPLYAAPGAQASDASDAEPESTEAIQRQLMDELVAALMSGLAEVPAADRGEVVELAQYFYQNASPATFPGLADSMN